MSNPGRRMMTINGELSFLAGHRTAMMCVRNPGVDVRSLLTDVLCRDVKVLVQMWLIIDINSLEGIIQTTTIKRDRT